MVKFKSSIIKESSQICAFTTLGIEKYVWHSLKYVFEKNLWGFYLVLKVYILELVLVDYTINIYIYIYPMREFISIFCEDKCHSSQTPGLKRKHCFLPRNRKFCVYLTCVGIFRYCGFICPCVGKCLQALRCTKCYLYFEPIQENPRKNSNYCSTLKLTQVKLLVE